MSREIPVHWARRQIDYGNPEKARAGLEFEKLIDDGHVGYEVGCHRLDARKKRQGRLREYATRMAIRVVNCPDFPEGIGFDRHHTNAVMLIFRAFIDTEGGLMNVIDELQGNYDAALELWKKYETDLCAFRSKVKDDVTSLEASARKTTAAVQRMGAQYQEVIAQLTSPTMQQAIENAERLAAAVSALSALQSHRMTFEVAERHEPGNGASS